MGVVEISEPTRKMLERIAANPDVTRLKFATIERLRIDKLIYVVEDDRTGKTFAHLKDRGRNALR